MSDFSVTITNDDTFTVTFNDVTGLNITVSETEPPNPQENDIWIDIS